MDFLGWLIFEDIDPNHPALQANRMVVVDSVSAGGYEMYLMRTSHPLFPADMKYQIAVQRSDLDFMNPSHQMNSSSLKDALGGVSAIRDFSKALKKWLGLYGAVSVSSLSGDKTRKWAMGLKWMGFDVSERSFELPDGSGGKEYLVVSPK